MQNKVKPFYMIFHPGDWLKDLALNACSFQTQGAWVRLLCHMHESESYGFLIVNNKPLDKKGVQKLLKMDDENFEVVWTELTEYGVMKNDSATGAYYSKRMVNDYKKFLQAAPVDEKLKQKISDESKMILKYLNKKSNNDFNLTDPEYIKLITQKFASGYSISDFKKVIDIKTEEWLGDKKMGMYLRPTTLFGAKFGEYLAQANSNKKTETDKSTKNANPYNNMMK